MRRFFACSTMFLLAGALAAQSPIISTFVGGLNISNPGPAAATQLFDIDVTATQGITINRIEVNSNINSGTSGSFGVWVTAIGGTHVGNQQIPSLWTQVAQEPVVHNGGRVSITLTTPFFLAQGRYGMALHHVGFNPVYTNPNTPVPPLPSLYSNNEVTLDMSAARVRTSEVNNPFGGTVVGFQPRHANVAIHYTVGAVSVDFTATPTRGASPLTVQFTAAASSGNPGGIFAYAWDFNNDGIVDSNAQNPQHIYTNCGNYSVTLTIIDAAGPHSVTKTNLIQTDIIVPAFTHRLIAPNTLQFTDQSSPAPTAWNWDLDGDGVTDSTQQNPTFVYSGSCAEVNVTLTATRACQPAVTLSKRIVVNNVLETRFDGGTVTVTTSTASSNMFDVNVTNPEGITICALHVHANAAVNTPFTVNVYTTPTTYVGNEANAAVWRLAGTTNATSRGGLQRTLAAFTPGIYLPFGRHGVCVEQVGSLPRYINVGGTATYSNADLTVVTGNAQDGPAFGAGTIFTPRVWNGAIYYSTCTQSGAAGYGFFGTGCAGTLGIPRNVALSQPRLSSTLQVQIDRLPLNAAFFLFSFSRTTSNFGPLPLDLAAFGAPGCFGRVSPDAVSLIVGAANAVQFNLTVPNNPRLLCTQFYTQALSVDPGLNALGGAISDAAAGMLGN